jgi:HTH-type transcriptional regulator / antitoxin HigA
MVRNFMKNKTRLCFEDLPKNYTALCRLLLPRPIHDAAGYAKVAEVTDAMAARHEEFSGDQADYFDLLCLLMEDYDAKRLHQPRFTAVDMLNRLMAQHCLSPADLSQILGGSRSLTATILRGERELRLKHVRKLVQRFGVSADNFLG